jgi:hypothetical protein
MLYSTTLWVAQTKDRRMIWLVNNELKCGRKQSWRNLVSYPSICLEEIKKATINQSGYPVLGHRFEPGNSQAGSRSATHSRLRISMPNMEQVCIITDSGTELASPTDTQCCCGVSVEWNSRHSSVIELLGTFALFLVLGVHMLRSKTEIGRCWHWPAVVESDRTSNC